MRSTKKDTLDKRFIFITILCEIGAVLIAIPIFLALFFTPLSGQMAKAADVVSAWTEATPARRANRTSPYNPVVYRVSTPIPILLPPQVTVQESGPGQDGVGTNPEGLPAVIEEEYREGELNGVRVGIFIKVRHPQLSPTPLPQPQSQFQPSAQSQFTDPGDTSPQDARGDAPTIIPSSFNEDTPLRGWPVQGKIKQGFGCSPYFSGIRGRDCGAPLPWFHDGVDIAATEGTLVRAMMAGTVTFAGVDGAGPACGEYRGFGKGVVLDSDDGWETLYAHLSHINVQVGDVVTPETVIGAVGQTGCATGPHLHFGLRHNGDLVNPKEYIISNKKG